MQGEALQCTSLVESDDLKGGAHAMDGLDVASAARHVRKFLIFRVL